MDYIRITNKACINDIEKEKFGFDYNQEFSKYKFFIGEKVKSNEVKIIQNSEDGCSYLGWKESIEKKYKDKPKKDLEEFAFYLKRRANMRKPEKEVYLVLLSVICVEGLAQLIKYLIGFQNILEEVGNIWIMAIICLLLESVLIIGTVFFLLKLISPIYDNSRESFFIEEYLNVINKIIEDSEM